MIEHLKVYHCSKISVACSIGLLLAFACPNAFGQADPPQNTGDRAMIERSMDRKVQVTLPCNPDTRKDRKLTRLEELPGIPVYSGKKGMIEGHELSGDGTLAYRFEFYAKEKPEAVAQWYTSALSMYNWQTADKSDTDITVTNPTGAMITVNAQKANRGEFNSVVKLYYTQGNQK